MHFTPIQLNSYFSFIKVSVLERSQILQKTTPYPNPRPLFHPRLVSSTNYFLRTWISNFLFASADFCAWMWCITARVNRLVHFAAKADVRWSCFCYTLTAGTSPAAAVCKTKQNKMTVHFFNCVSAIWRVAWGIQRGSEFWTSLVFE